VDGGDQNLIGNAGGGIDRREEEAGDGARS
jgi:hypothetical protein